ncbi:MAG: FAD-dependent monooxygenase [Planctomycetota bacterium]|nr:FAD-dependent monooxygenase [Planctomycetota bacterium]
MKIACIGGGPGGLYACLLLKKRFPAAEVTVYERNGPDDTFGWGVVFSSETLSGFQTADPESFAAIEASFAYWDDIDTHYGGEVVHSTGHGFCGLSRKRLLNIFQERCRDLDVDLRFETEIADEGALEDADVIIAADGINSVVREKYATHFMPSIDWRRCKFTWLGTNKPLKAFTFIFVESEFGLFQVHAYPFEVGEQALSTWIVECHEDVWKRAGLEDVSEEQTVEFIRKLFAEHLEGYELYTNKSIWRTFPTVRCQRWVRGNVALLGDAVHTAHFSIGSGTKLAMEDAIALSESLGEALSVDGAGDVPAALEVYEQAREVDCIKIQKAAQTSLEWFENSARYMAQHPLQLTFNLMTRSKRITYGNLAERDPELVERVRDWWCTEQGAPDAKAPIFAPFALRDLILPNRMVVSPMCQYSADEGTPGDWHLMHLGARAVGGAGLLITESTAVCAEGRITYGCTGMYQPEHVQAWRRITDFVHTHSATPIGIQLCHAGRKASCSLPWEGDKPLEGQTAWPTMGPCAEGFDAHWPSPRAMDRADMDAVVEQFVQSAKRALEAGFDLVELHMAHGYLLSSFLSPASNRRSDEYGGDLEGRMRFPLEVCRAVRAVWPAHMPLAVRISATDWLQEGGQTAEDSVQLAQQLSEAGCDLIDVSTAGNTPRSEPGYGRMYQVPFAERIRHEVDVAVMAVGAIQGWDHANTVLAAGRADLCALARPHLLHPHLSLEAAAEFGQDDQSWPVQYLAAKPAPAE